MLDLYVEGVVGHTLGFILNGRTCVTGVARVLQIVHCCYSDYKEIKEVAKGQV